MVNTKVFTTVLPPLSDVDADWYILNIRKIMKITNMLKIKEIMKFLKNFSQTIIFVCVFLELAWLLLLVMQITFYGIHLMVMSTRTQNLILEVMYVIICIIFFFTFPPFARHERINLTEIMNEDIKCKVKKYEIAMSFMRTLSFLCVLHMIFLLIKIILPGIQITMMNMTNFNLIQTMLSIISTSILLQ